jgi:hypothetical protein
MHVKITETSHNFFLRNNLSTCHFMISDIIKFFMGWFSIQQYCEKLKSFNKYIASAIHFLTVLSPPVNALLWCFSKYTNFIGSCQLLLQISASDSMVTYCTGAYENIRKSWIRMQCPCDSHWTSGLR